jgi:hypothetical protein
MPMKRVLGQEDEAKILEIEGTAGPGSIRNRPICHAYPIRSANQVWMFIKFESSFSAVRLVSHREERYDLTDS